MSWRHVPFDDLPPSGADGLRWMGSTLMDREAFETEGWERRHIGDHAYWRARSTGLREMSRRVSERKAERRARWDVKQASDDEWSREVERIVEAHG